MLKPFQEKFKKLLDMLKRIQHNSNHTEKAVNSVGAGRQRRFENGKEFIMKKQKMAAAARSAAPHDALDLLGKVRIILTSGDERAIRVLTTFITFLLDRPVPSDRLDRHSATQQPAPEV